MIDIEKLRRAIRRTQIVDDEEAKEALACICLTEEQYIEAYGDDLRTNTRDTCKVCGVTVVVARTSPSNVTKMCFPCGMTLAALTDTKKFKRTAMPNEMD